MIFVKDSWLEASKLDSTKVELQDIKTIIDSADCALWSNDVSFQYQGFNWWLGQIDASIFPTDIAPKVWNQPDRHGDGQAFLTKHFKQLFNALPFFKNLMASKLYKALKQRGIV